MNVNFLLVQKNKFRRRNRSARFRFMRCPVQLSTKRADALVRQGNQQGATLSKWLSLPSRKFHEPRRICALRICIEAVKVDCLSSTAGY